MAEETPKWLETVPEEMRAPLSKFKEPSELAKSYLEVEKAYHASIRPPGPDAPPEARAEFVEKIKKQVPELVYTKDENALLSALGKPAKAEEYEPSKELGDLPKELVDNWRAQSANLGLTKKQAAEALKQQFTQYSELNTRVVKSQEELKKEWGAALEERTTLVAKTMEQLGFPAEAIAVVKSGKASAGEMKAFYAVAKGMGNDRPANENSQSGTSTGPVKMTPLEIRTRIGEIMKNPAYFQGHKDPTMHEHLTKEVVRLHGLLPDE